MEVFMSSRFKKGLSVLLAAASVVTTGQFCAGYSAAAEEIKEAVSKITGGDVNGDGKTNDADVDAISAFIGKTAAAAGKNSKFDLYNDGAVDVRDLLAARQLADGLAPVKPEKEASGDTVKIEVGSAECVPGEQVTVDVNIIDWDQEIGAVELYLDFDSSLTLSDVSCTGKYQYVSDGNQLKIFGLTENADVFRGTVATLVFDVPDTAYGDYDVKVKSCAVYNDLFQSLKPTTAVGLIAADVTERPLYLAPSYLNSKSMRLTWSMPYCSGDLEGYIVYRDGKELTRVKDTEFYDQKLETGKKYQYEVQAYGADGYLSAKSKAITAVPQEPVISALGFTDNAAVIGGKSADLRATMEKTVDASAYSLTYIDKQKKKQTIFSGENSAVSAADIRWNLRDVPSGDYTLTFSITDKDGATAEKSLSVTVDTTPPEQVFGFDVFEGEKEMKLTWGIAAEAKVVGYNLYRRSETGTYKLLKYIDSRETLEYVDKDLKEGEIYFYMMCAVDNFGQEGIYSDEKSAAAKGDETDPELTLFLPESGKVLSHYVTISVKAEDNVGVSSVAGFISEDDGKTWSKLFEGKGSSASYSFDTTKYKEASIKLRALAYDYAGNESKELVHIYAVDNQGPAQVVNVRSAAVTDVTASIAWDDVPDDDFSYFTAKYYPTDDKEKVSTTSTSSTLGVNLYSLTPNTAYTIEVAAVDIYGNVGEYSEPFGFETVADGVAPIIAAFGPTPGYFNKSIPLSIGAQDDYSVASVTLQASQSNAKDAKWSDVAVIENENGGSYFNASYSLDLADFKEGKIYLRAFAADSSGNKGELSAVYEHIIKRTAPAAPTKFSASSDSNTIELKWEPYEDNTESAYFSLYRSDAEDGEYAVILEKSNSVNYFDRSAEPGKTYYYKLTAIDAAGNESEMSKAVKAVLKEDTEKPQIESISPAETEVLSTAYNKVSALVSDNVKLASVTIEYRISEKDKFQTLTEVKDINDYYSVVEGTLPEEVLKAESVEIRVSAVDGAGLKADAKTAKYTIDNSFTDIKEINAEQLPDHILIKWKTEENKLSTGYYIYKKANTASWQRIGSIAADPERKGEYEFTDLSVNAAGTVMYKVEAYCSNGIMTEKETEPIQIYTAPEASLVVENAQQQGVEYIFDATGCRDYYGIESIVLDFGDGTKASDTSAATAKFVHKYKDTGVYTATLTCTNEQGLVSTCERTIEVIERVLLGESTVYVKTTDGKSAAGINVYVDLGQDRQKKLVTDSNGQVKFTTVAGIHTIGVFGDGYLPAEKECTILAGTGNKFEFAVVEKDIVTADFKVERMKLDEIKAAGIDITAPENQHIVEVEVNLTYKAHEHDKGRMKFLANGKGSIVGGGGWAGGWGGGSWGGGSGTGSVTKPVYVNINPKTNEVETLITMTVPVKASFLKEFFHASLTVYNNADQQYTISQNEVKLNLPDGLTLVETEKSDSANVSFDVLEGQSFKDIDWIIRGDKEGKYDISASYSGHLDRFNEQITAEFTPDEPITVYGEKAVAVDIIVPQQLFDNRFVFEVRMTNNCPVDVYCPNTDVGAIISSALGNSNSKVPDIYQRSIKKDGKYVRILPADEPPLEVLEPGFSYSVIYECEEVFKGIDGVGEDSFYDSRLDVVSASLKVLNNSRIPVSLTVVPNTEFLIVDEIKELKYDHKTESVLFVTGGRYEKPLKDATVTFNGVSKNTGEDGYVVLTIPTDGENHNMTISCGGFKRKLITPYIGYTNGIDYIQLESNGLYEQEETEDDKHYDPGHVTTGYSDGGGNIATPGAFGDPEDETYEYQHFSGNMTIGEELEYEFPEDIPIIGGHTYKLDNLNLPVKLGIDDEGFVSLIIADPDFDLTKIGKSEEEKKKKDEEAAKEPKCIQDEFKKTCEILNEYKGKTIKQVAEDIKKAPIKKNPLNFKDGEFKAEAKIIGALSASYDPKKGFAECCRSGGIVFRGQLLIQFEFKYEWKTTLVVASVPVAIAVGVGLKLNVDTTFTIECNNGDLEVTGNLMVTAAVTGEVFAGVGVAGAMAAGVYGEVTLTFVVTLLSLVPEDMGLNKITFEYEVGVKAYIGPFELSKSLLSPDDPIILYTKYKEKNDNKTKASNGVYSLLYDESMYALEAPVCTSVWTAAKKTSIASENGYLPLTELASKTNDMTQLQLAAVGDKLVMVYIDTDSSRDAANSQRLMYTVYTEKNGWSTPAQLDGDKTGDSAPYLWTDGKKMYVIYQNSAQGLSEKSALEDWTAAQNIAVAEFNTETGKFGGSTAITSDKNVLDKSPAITTVGDTTYAVWVSNTESSYFGTNESNSIMVSELGENGWSAPEAVISGINAVTDITAASHDDQLYIVYVNDDDNDLTTMDDRSLRTFKYGEAQPYFIASGCISCPVFTKADGDTDSCLYWQQDANIRRSEDFTNAQYLFDDGVPAVASGFEIVGDRIIWTSADDKNESNVYESIRDSKTGVWGAPVRLTDQGQYLRNIRAAAFGKDIVTVMDRTKTTITEEDVQTSSSIVSLNISSITNIAVTSADYLRSDYETGETLPVTIGIENLGDNAVKSVHVTIAYDKGKSVYDEVIDCDIQANAYGSVKAEITPEASKEYTVTVNTADDSDTFTDNNTFRFSTAFSNIEIEAEKTDDNTVAVTLTNSGTASGADTITVEELGTGRVIDTIEVAEIAAGKSVTQNLDLTKYSDVTTGGITISGSGIAAPVVLYDAMDGVETAPETLSGDVNGDGKVDAKDASMILVYYSKMSTGGDGGFAEQQKKAADMNGDSYIDAKDASAVLAVYAKASTSAEGSN